MKRIVYPAFAAVMAVLPLCAAESPITEKNWRSHPAIVEIRGIFNEIEDAVKTKHLIEKTVNEPAGTSFIDGAAEIRKFVSEGGGEDSAYTVSQYFDKKGTLRFIFVTAGAVNGAAAEYRIYFDAAGKKIWENRTITTKQGYTFPETWPADAIPHPRS